MPVTHASSRRLVAAQDNGFPAQALRKQFPALARAGDFAFFDNAAGAQIPQASFDAVNHLLVANNAQRGGRFYHSIAVDETVARGRASIAAFLNARRPEEVALGMNATSFIRTISLAIGQSLQGRDEIIVTELDHEANIGTWLALAPFGAKFVWWKLRKDGNLHLEDLEPLLSPRTRLVACTLASNALGTIVDVRAVADLAHAAGAEIFVDAVHFGPHGLIDVQAFDCDYLVCSGYKIFAPHMGFLWGRYELLKSLPTFREDFIPDEPPFKIEAGTFIYENVAGMDAAIGYLASVGAQLAANTPHRHRPTHAIGASTLQENLRTAMTAIRAYEQELSIELLRVLQDYGATIYGIDDPAQVSRRVPTFCFNLPGVAPAAVSEALAAANIGIRDGHLYTPRLMESLGLEIATGAARVSLVHYNTVAEVHRFGAALRALRR